MFKKEWRKTIASWLKHKDECLLANELPCAQKFATVNCCDFKDETERYSRILADQKDNKIKSLERVTNIIGLDEQLSDNQVDISLLVLSTHIYRQNDKTNTEQQKNVLSFSLVLENDCWRIASFAENGVTPQDSRIISTNDFTENLSTSQSVYNRLAAVDYANRYWENPNPQFAHFKDDCTNFVSQCLWTGGFPMIKTGDQKTGWWYESRARQYGNTQNDIWSYSWSVAHSLNNYLNDNNRVEKKEDPRELDLGDVISYSWSGGNKAVYNHSTIVVAKDYNGFPLVSAHSIDSTYRPWQYRDSTSWTPNIGYSFYHIL